METKAINRPYNYTELGILYVAWLALLVYVFLNAWVAEDAYITFRVIDNFMNGYGLRWNVNERVQAYTHPLWMLLHLPMYAVWKNLYYSNIALSITCTMTALLVVLASVRKPLLVTLCCFFLPLALSKSFFDYTTSGLENPLSYLLFACFGYVVLTKHNHPYFWLMCSLTVSLSLFNRLDTVLFYVPTLLWMLHTRAVPLRWGQMILGTLPLIGWLAFSLVYYGFLFPNTKYGKLNTGIGTIFYIRQGLHYARYLLVTDLAGCIALLAPVTHIALVFLRPRMAPLHPLRNLPLTMAIGICWYFFYVIYIGGDYMMGRFWALPVFASVWLAYVFMPSRLRYDMLFALACLLSVAFIAPKMLGEIQLNCKKCGVERGRLIDARYTFHLNSLITKVWPLTMRREGDYMFKQDGLKLARQDPPPVKRMYYIGMSGYYGGPGVVLLDELGLADPFLARMPAVRKQGFYIGHFRRDLPRGYQYAVKTGSTERMDPALAEYYKKLRLIVSGDIFDPERLKTILLFNLGLYDHWKQEYFRRLVQS